ncbi:ATP-binding protein [Virgisporangium aurantiacum]|uniref:ATPase n=1 Tax=Virgisporangium aurantiacum TaxID=175570 RepID=A0A8J4E854_9ACTN|nr:tetratricopeptide repeat protein [Virgisporangium aurantiacum]GIJ62457.1 ATPase [Virgisporangium aurantiacum]
MTASDREHPRYRFARRLNELFAVADLTNDRVATVADELVRNGRVHGLTDEDRRAYRRVNGKRLSEWRHPREPAVPQGWAQLAAVLTALAERARRKVGERVELYDMTAWRQLYDEAAKSRRPADATGPSASQAAMTGTVDPDSAAAGTGFGSTPGAARFTLPAREAAFTGRDRELGAVVDGVVGAARAGGIVAIHAIDGMAGVGKTTFAVQVGHVLASTFPDRQLFVDLKGHTAGQVPSDPADALASLITAEGISPQHLPAGLDERAAMWRALMADKRVLLILDNAAHSDQVRPLLPGSPGSLVLVTSRRMLADLAAASVALDTLSPDEAERMFVRLAARAVDEPDDVTKLVARCGYLPLAISLLAGVLNKHRRWTVRDLLDESAADILGMKAERRTLAAAFDLSYQAQPVEVRRLFQVLGLHPGIEFEPFAVAALADVTVDTARSYLDDLSGDHLLIEPAHRRYRMHDLVREYARSLAESMDADERDQALDRLLDFYEDATTAADARLRDLDAVDRTPRRGLPALADRRAALTWLSTEIASVTACIDLAARDHRAARVLTLTSAVAAYLRAAGPWEQARRLQVAAVTAARHVDDPGAEAAALTELGTVEERLGDYPAAARALDNALSINHDLDNRRGQADVLAELAVVRHLSGDYPGAVQALNSALTIYRDGGHRDGEAGVLAELGVVHRVTGNHRQASDVLTQALAIFRNRSDRQGEAKALTNLGLVQWSTVHVATAIDTLVDALACFVDLDDRIGEADTLHYLGLAKTTAADLPAADRDLQRSLRICGDIRYRHGAAGALVAVGDLRVLTGAYTESAAVCDQANRIYSTLGNLHGQARSLLYLAQAHRLAGNRLEAHAALDGSERLFDELGNEPGMAAVFEQRGHFACTARDYTSALEFYDRALQGSRDSPVEAAAFNHRGIALRLLGRIDDSMSDHTRALGIARATGYVRQEAKSLDGLGRCELELGRIAKAAADLAHAVELYRIAAPVDAAQLALDLQHLTGMPAERQ